MKFALGLIIGAIGAWILSADLYARTMTTSPIGGLFCRVEGLEAVRVSALHEEPEFLCMDLSTGIPEDEIVANILAWVANRQPDTAGEDRP